MRLSGTKTGAVNQYRGLGNQLWDLAGNRPSLDLQFADSKSLVDATTGTNLVDHTRASSGTYVGSDGLIKTATTNLLLRSEEFDNAAWTKFNSSIVANALAAPNGTTTGDKIIESADNGSHIATQNATVSSGATATISLYAKAAERSQIILWIQNSGDRIFAKFNLSTESYSSGALGTVVFSSASIQPVGNGWYRISLTGSLGGKTLYQIQIGIVDASGNDSYTGDGTSGIYLWGAQLEQSSTVGEYVKTTSTINSAPRFDHDPETGESLGLLVEAENGTNLITDSEDLSSWGGAGAKNLDAAVTDPSGNTGTVYYPSISEVYTTFNANSATQIAVSCFVKQRSGETADTQLQVFQSVTGTVVFLGAINLPLSGTFAPGGNFSSGTRIQYPNGWYRFTFLANANPAQGTGTFTNAARIDIEGGVSTNYVWGVQVETGSFPTSYIPTEGSTVTRAADVASISGSNFSSWYRQDEGTVFADVGPSQATNFPMIYDITDGSTANSIRVNTNSSGLLPGLSVINASISQATVTVTKDYGIAYKSAAAFKSNSFQHSVNSVLGTEDTAGTLPGALTTMTIGRRVNGTLPFVGSIRRLTYWPTRLPNETLQGITQ